MKNSIIIICLLIGAITAQERSISGSSRRNNRFSAGKSQAINFNCPEDFGYYAHPSDCSQYYVCVFGGALLESCTGGLMYSHDLQTCDWPRNVVCDLNNNQVGISTVKIVDPRTSSKTNSQVISATESLTPSASSLSRGVDNAINGRHTVKNGNANSKAVFEDSPKLRQGRLLPRQESSSNRNLNSAGFQAQETSSRIFNVVPEKPVFPPSLPKTQEETRFVPARSQTSAPVTKPLFKDQLNQNDTDYYYYYDDILYDDYYEPTTTPKSASIRSPARSRGNAEPIESVSPSVIASSSVDHKRRGSSRASPTSSISSSLTSSSSPSTSSFPGTFSSSSRSTKARGGASPSIGTSEGKARGTASGSSSSSSSRKTSQASSKAASPSGSPPQLVGRTPQRLIRPSKKPAPSSTRSNLITDVWDYPPRRPTPVYPQPPVDVKAAPCDPAVCRLPDCFCGGKHIPGDLPPQNIPQTVLLTFDDSVNDLNKKLYIDLFEKGRVNPNGCPIAATFYVSHEWTDYSQVQNLYSDGHEIASHSISHSFGEQFSIDKWSKEIGGQREIMSAYGGVRMEDIRGMRAPFLAVGGNKMFRMLYDLNFTYDSSMPVYENLPPSWPYTLDYRIFHDCMIPPCPTNSFPGVWQVPMVMWQDLNGGRCSMGDACTTPPDAEGVYKFLIKNFERHYTSNRSPLGLFYHAAWFTTPHHKEGFIAFLDTITAMDDVWLVTNWQALQWVRDPTPLSQIKSFAPFQCDYPERPPRCNSPRVCNVWHKGSVRYLKTCGICPESYPWTGNTGVKSPLNDI